MPNIEQFGSGVGLLYITDLNNVVLSNIPNTSTGVDQIKNNALARAPVAADINAIGSVTITSAAADNTTGLTIDGVAQISGSVANTVGDEEQTAQDIATAVNDHIPVSGGDYKAVAVGAKILLIAPSSLGSSVNGDVVAIAFDGATTATKVNVAGGQDGSGVNSTINGRRYHINASAGAPQGDITGATEITDDLIMRGLQHRIDSEDVVISVGTVAPTRTLSIMHLNVDTEAAAGTDDLDSIDIGDYVLGDILIVSGIDVTRVVTLTDTSVSLGTIKLTGEVPFSTGSKENVIVLRLVEDSVNGTLWHEMWRSPAISIDALAFVTEGFPLEAGTQELDIDTFALPATVTLSAVSPLSPSWTNVIHASPGAIGANFEIALPAAGTAQDGQKLTVKYSAAGVDTSGAGDVIIFGVTLTDQEALQGGVIFEAILNTDASAWNVTKYYDFQIDELIATAKLEDKAVTGAKIANDAAVDANRAIDTEHIKDSAVETAKILDDNVTGPKIADLSITVAKLGADEKKEVFTSNVSWETGELGEYQVVIPYKCDVIGIFSRVTLQVAATDQAKIQFANNTGNMADGLLCHSAGAAFGDQQTDIPTTNTEILAGQPVKFTTSKTTPGGKALVTIHVQRKA